MANQSRPPADRNRELFFSIVGRHLEGLSHYVRHRLSYAESVGDVLRGELVPEDVVDEVMVRAYRECVKNPPERSIKSWLIRLANADLDAQVKRLRSWRAHTPARIEQDIPETPPVERVSTLGDEVLDFYEPDEDLKLEDVIPDLRIPPPDAETETSELRQCVDAALGGLPRQWRRALVLHHVEGLAGKELAEALGAPPAEVQEILDRARHYLRQRLTESGCGFTAGGG